LTHARTILASIISLALASPALAQPTQTPAQTIIENAAASSQAETGNMFCPVMTDEEIDPNFFSIYKGRKVYLCCKRCRTKFEADPEAYIANLPPLVDTASLMTNASQTQTSTDTPAEDGHGQTDHEDPATTTSAQGENDHAEHAKGATGITSLLSYLGRFHVLITHFPIALLSFGAFFEGVSILGIGGSNAKSVSSIVRASIGFGALGAVAAISLGLMNSIGEDYSGILSDVFWWHRLLGITTAVMALLAWFAVERRARKSTPGTIAFARATILLTAALVGITGHLGGSLVFGWDYLVP
jgi:uncharacterized membrane protein/YHS domain-containing protein